MDGRSRLLVLALCAAGLVRAHAGGQVVINEFAYDDQPVAGVPDGQEYVELYNAGAAAVDLSGWALETGGATAGPTHEVADGASIEPEGYFVIGSPQVPEVDQEIPTADLFGDGPSYIILRSADGTVADSVVYEANKGTAGFPGEAFEGGGIWGNQVLVSGTPFSWQRWRDGYDTDENGADFGQLPWTPGGTNDRTGPPRFASTFEERDPETDLAEFPGTFVAARVIDPLLASASNPSPIPESPDGGYALVAWDPSGGGNAVVFDAEPVEDLMFEAWVYFDATPRPAGEMESWSIGLRGTTGTYYNFPVLYTANGNTGVTWTYQVTSSGATLYLIDEGIGVPPNERVQLGAIDIVPGENDGWQRLRLDVAGDAAAGIFGGTYGSTGDGERIDGEIEAGGIGSFYIGYREGLTDNASVRPITLDALVVGPPGPGGTPFERGDVNANRALDLGDAIFLLNYLFASGAAPGCLDASDINDDGQLDVGDAVRLLNYLFASGPEPAPPFGACGADPTPDDPLGCEAFPRC
ncbi:MAG: lamin tail domain-containing protein [Planctomycetes bacterium]|nr:lamin tail domain-containing protein [Planctomycetota bacterium]